MHEFAICQSIVAQAETVARQRDSRVRAITLKIGPLSGVEAQLLQHAYPLASAGSLCDGAELYIELLPVLVHCQQCGKQTQAQPNRLLCSHCGDWRTDLLGGDELLLASLELYPQRSQGHV